MSTVAFSLGAHNDLIIFAKGTPFQVEEMAGKT